MFQQRGGLSIDPDVLYKKNPSFKSYADGTGVNWGTASNLQKAQLASDFSNYMAAQGADVASGVDIEGARLDRSGPAVEANAFNKEAMLADPAMVACKTAASCKRDYSEKDIVNELDRRGFRDGGRYKYVMVHKSDIDGIPSGKTYSGPASVAALPAGKRYAEPDINQFRPDDNGEFYRVRADYNDKTTFHQLVSILLASNKRISKQAQAREKFSSRTGKLRYARGAFPSETTNPAMYDPKTGLLKENFLTMDHHGLTAYDFKGDRYRVEWTPFGSNGGGKAKWVPYQEGAMAETMSGLHQLRGVFDLAANGLPKITQLNDSHLGKFHKDKNGKLWQVQCKKRGKTCLRKRDGSLQLKWGKYDPKATAIQKVEERKKKFITPLGVFTYDQLMKMPLDNILKMMIVLELMDESPKYAMKMQKLGVGPFSKDGMLAALPGRQRATMVKGAPKSKTALDDMARQLQEKKYLQAGLPKCEFPEPPYRCYTDSYIPGTCVPDEAMCFKPGLRKPWKDYMDRKYPGKMDWAETASANASQFVTEKDIEQMYKEASQGSQAGDWLVY